MSRISFRNRHINPMTLGAAVFVVATSSPAAAVNEDSEADWAELDSASTDAEQSEAFEPRGGVVFLPRAGLLVTGSGALSTESHCYAPDCAPIEPRGTDYDDASGLILEADLLFHVAPELRLGFGTLLVPQAAIDGEDYSGETGLGMELTPVGIVEAVFGGKLAGTARGFVGMPILFPGDDLETMLQDTDDACDVQRSEGGSCSVDTGPFYGITLGLGAGILSQLSADVAVRGDLTLQYQYTGIYDVETAVPMGSYEASVSSSTTRIWLMAGIEF